MSIRTMDASEFDEMKSASVDAFGGDPGIARLIDALRASWAWDDDLCFVADADGEIVGQVLYSHALVDAPERLIGVLVLSPIGVRPDLQGRGIGSKLITETLTALGDRDEPMVFLEGSPRYYRRFGFEGAATLGFEAPSARIPEAAFMVYRLAGYRPSMRGRLVYPDAFWVTDSVGLR